LLEPIQDLKASASFLKKRSKKLLSISFAIAYGVPSRIGCGTPTATPNQVLKVFWFFFSKKTSLLRLT
jgi:hypothetical protein